MSEKTVSFNFGNEKITLSTGLMAKQANGSVLVTQGDTVILVTVVAASSNGEIKGFLPLSVDLRMKTDASGEFPGGFFKRDGRPNEAGILKARAIDRMFRPGFADNFYDDVQIIATVLSLEPGHIVDVPASVGVAAAIKLAGLPFNATVASARIGRVNEQFVINPKVEDLTDSTLDMLVAGSKDAVVMVEAGAAELSEGTMLEAIKLAHDSLEPVFKGIDELVAMANVEAYDWVQPPELDESIVAEIANEINSDLKNAYQISEKLSRKKAISKAKQRVKVLMQEKHADTQEAIIALALSKVEYNFVRDLMVANNARIDGRSFTEIRNINTKVNFLPRAHGSALFTRGETQALVSLTLGGAKDAQLLDDGTKENFMLHYNFPPYSVGEVGFMGSPKRREIGHGNLAKRALEPVLPKDCPYVIRLVSDVLESNGSSSMATVCGGSLALMSSGINLSAPVAGIAMGLIHHAKRFIILSDILGDEDHLGDMDFKVAGTIAGITALQMDIKISGLSKELLEEAMNQAREGRLHILQEMAKTVQDTSDKMSPYAPRMETITINPDKIRDVIGRGGATIKEITESFNVEIDITDDGKVSICAKDSQGLDSALNKIKELTTDVEVGQIYTGKIVKIMDFGAFVSLIPGKDGFLHISQIAHERVENISDYLQEGQEVTVKAIELDKQGRIRVSIKAINTKIAG